MSRRMINVDESPRVRTKSRFYGTLAVRRALTLALAGSLAGVSCNTRFREALVEGATNYVYSTLLDPATIADIVIQSTAGEQ